MFGTTTAMGLAPTASETDPFVLTANPTGSVEFPRLVAPGTEVVAVIEVPYETGVRITSIGNSPSAHMMRQWQEGDPTRMGPPPLDWKTYLAELLPDGRVMIAFTMPATHITILQGATWDLTRWYSEPGSASAFVRRDTHEVTIQLSVGVAKLTSETPQPLNANWS